MFADWPIHIAGQHAFVPHGLVEFNTGPHPLAEVFHLHGFQLVSWNIVVLVGLGMFALMLAWAAIAWRRGRVKPRATNPASREPDGRQGAIERRWTTPT